MGVEIKMLEDRLTFIFSNVNEWLKFGEAKNGALLAINITSIFSAFDKIPYDTSNWLLFFIWFFILMNLFSAFTVLASYLPHLKAPEKIHSWLIMSNTKNALYYGDLSQMTSNDLINLLNLQVQTTPYALMIADQIICNSKIATKKYEFFTLALYFTVTAYIFPVFAALGYLIYKKIK